MDTSQSAREIRKDEEIIEKEKRDVNTLDTKIDLLKRSKTDLEQKLKDLELDLKKTKESEDTLRTNINDIRQTLLPKDEKEMKRLIEEKNRKEAIIIEKQKEIEEVQRQIDDAVNRQKNA